MKMNKVVYACNDALFDGLYLSILSILRRTKSTFSFYLLTADYSYINPKYLKLTDEHAKIIDNLVKKYNSKNSFTVIDCFAESKKFLASSKNIETNFSPYDLFRLLIDLYPEFDDKVLYIDTDTMAVGDLNEIFEIDLEDNEFAVCHNYSGRWYLKKDSFNAGVMLFNMKEARKNDFFKKSRNEIFKKKYVWPDQTAMYKSKTKFKFFPGDEYRFNRQQIKIKKGDIIKHFSAHFIGWPLYNNIKQWQIKLVKRFYKYTCFDEDYEIFDKMKREIKNQYKNDFFINVSHLRKTYGGLKAVDDISFKVKKGSLFAFLGVNGAGKSTTINIISSTLKKDSGDIYIDALDLDKDNADVKKKIGIVFQNSVLDTNLSVEENLKIRGMFYKMKKEKLQSSIDRVVKMLNLEPILKQDVGKLSGGQRRRVDIARALIHEPELLILDEPTTGLDPKTRLDVWKLIDDIRIRTNMTVFLTTHYLEEAEKATYVVIMDKGKVIAEGTPNELKNKYSSDYVISFQKKDKQFEKCIENRSYIYDNDANAYKISVKNGIDARELINNNKEYICDYEVKKGNMDDVFLNVTGRK